VGNTAKRIGKQPVVQTCLHFIDVYIYDVFGGISNIDIFGFFAVTHFVGCHAIFRVVFAVSRWVKIITLSDKWRLIGFST
jgi:hypothetical protein